MIRLNDFLDKLSIIKVLSFFLLIILVFTLIPMVFKIHLGSLFFKFILYGIMLLFFAYELNKIDFDEISFKAALRKEYDSLVKEFKVFRNRFKSLIEDEIKNIAKQL